MNTLGEGVIAMLAPALDRVERDGLHGPRDRQRRSAHVHAPAPICRWCSQVAGAATGRSSKRRCAAFRTRRMRIRHVAVPGRRRAVRPHARRRLRVLAARRPRAGARRAVHGARGGRRRTHSRPAAERRSCCSASRSELAPYAEADPFEAVKRAFQAHRDGDDEHERARRAKLGFLRAARSHHDEPRPSDRRRGGARLDLAPDYVAPPPRTITALGKEAFGNLSTRAWAMREGGPDHRSRGADRARARVRALRRRRSAAQVTEQDILDLEREAFLGCSARRRRRSGSQHMLKTGKPLRN